MPIMTSSQEEHHIGQLCHQLIKTYIIDDTTAPFLGVLGSNPGDSILITA